MRDLTADPGPAGNIQAHLLRATKFKNRPRDWSLFFFFRIMAEAEMKLTSARLIASDGEAWSRVKLDLEQPALMSASVTGQDGRDPTTGGGPAAAFRAWLKVLASANRGALVASTRSFVGDPDGTAFETGKAILRPEIDLVLNALPKAPRSLFAAPAFDLRTAFARVFSALEEQATYLHVLESLGAHLQSEAAEQEPLPMVVLYEVLRQAAPAFVAPAAAADGERSGMVRGETAPLALGEGADYDGTPVTLAFTYPGLSTLELDPTTLASFPEVFRQGMAARAARLHDVGDSAPEFWEGELGLPSVHGYFTGGFDRPRPVREAFWRALRQDIRAFNDPASERGEALRFWVGLVFRALGMEIVQIELGQDPYEVWLDKAWPLPNRVEHFGFRDGLSQPFVDMKLGAPGPGGATPSRNGTWTPVAPGEIFLHDKDEGGQTHASPAHPILRDSSTYLVFRKLEQDVQGLRDFLDEQRPGDESAQATLGAQFVGRWKSGTPLLVAPRTDRNLGSEAALNDFRYRADDPTGRKCPLGAHIRRANPRDIGGRGDVRHHRILRRGMSYGGPLLSEETPDLEPRGLLFIAANARIDLQFEVIQSDWLNSGEFLGQAGLGRCPLTGAHSGGPEDTFQEPQGLAPVRGLPSFITNRGGDYFFAPGIEAIRGLGRGDPFSPPEGEVPFDGHSMADPATPSLFSMGRIGELGGMIFGGTNAVRVRHKNASTEVVAFVGRWADVAEVLRNDPAPHGKCPAFSVAPYAEASSIMTRGDLMLIATEDDGGAGGDARKRMMGSLNLAWRALDAASGGKLDDRVRQAATDRLTAALRRVGPMRRVDLIDDLAAQAAYGVLVEIFGTEGPDYLTELAGALPFARQHLGDLPRDWLAALKGEAPADPGMTSMQIWSVLMVSDLIGNLQNLAPLHALSRQAASEMLAHIDRRLAEAMAAFSAPPRAPRTLVEAFIFNHATGATASLYPGDLAKLYAKEVSLILLEIIGSTLAVIPLTFASVMQTLLALRIDLTQLLPKVGDAGVRRLIYEAERLNPNIAARVRRCQASTKVGKSTVEEDDFVAALVALANRDEDAFPQAHRFSLAGVGVPELNDGPPRDPSKYLLFGVAGSHKDCWGRNLVAMPVLEECLWAAGRLRWLRQVAGPGGAPRKLAGLVTVGLPGRFTGLQPPLKP